MKKMWLLLTVLMTDSAAFGQSYPVLADTNQIKLLPPNIKIEWRTNLYEAQTVTFVVTNWMPVGVPIDVTLPDGRRARRQHEAATLLTNVQHEITHDGIKRIWVVRQTLGPILETRHYDFEPPLTEPFLAVPNRQIR